MQIRQIFFIAYFFGTIERVSSILAVSAQQLQSASVAQSTGACSARIPVVVDTDIGNDCDDLWSLSYVAARPEVFDLRLVVAATRNTTGRAQIIAKILQTIGRTDVAVGVGPATTPYVVGPEYPWAQHYDLNAYPGTLRRDGVQAMVEEIEKGTATCPVYVLELAPATNLGLVLKQRPDLAAQMRVFAMSGSIYRGYLNASHSDREYNVYTDVVGSQYMYNSTYSQPLVTAPLDTSGTLQIVGDIYAAFLQGAQSGGPAAVVAATVLENYEVWYAHGGKSFTAMRPFSPTSCSSTLYDLQPAFMLASLVDPALRTLLPRHLRAPVFPDLIVEGLHVEVDSEGWTRVVDHGGPIVYPAVAWAGGWDAGVSDLARHVVQTLIGYSPDEVPGSRTAHGPH